MNCKPGDLAIIVRSTAGNEGKIVRCLRIRPDIVGLRQPDGSISDAAVWQIDAPIQGWSGEWSPFISDFRLRPIRPDEGMDETLQWADVPRKVAA